MYIITSDRDINAFIREKEAYYYYTMCIQPNKICESKKSAYVSHK